jgi:hypothetical protein
MTSSSSCDNEMLWQTAPENWSWPNDMYGKLKKAPWSQNVEAWSQSWEQIYTNCKKLKLPVVEYNLPLYDLLSAVVEIAPEFSSV